MEAGVSSVTMLFSY